MISRRRAGSTGLTVLAALLMGRLDAAPLGIEDRSLGAHLDPGASQTGRRLQASPPGITNLTIVSDLTHWSVSTIIDEVTADLVPWPGVTFLPAASTYTVVPSEGAPHVLAVPGATTLQSGFGVRFFRSTFRLPILTTVALDISASFDNDLQIFFNGHELALEGTLLGQSFAGPNHRLVVNPDGSIVNGKEDGQAFSTRVASSFPSTFFRTGENEIVLVLRNLNGNDNGGMAFRADFLLDGVSDVTCSPPPPGIIAWWAGEGTARDVEGIHSGTLSRGDSFTQGKVGSALLFDGGNFVQVPDAPALRPAQVTIEAWVRFDSLENPSAKEPGLQYILFKRNGRTRNFEGYALLKHRIEGVDRISFQVTSANGAIAHVDSIGTVAVNQWHHVAGTYDGSASRLYVDGVEQGARVGDFQLDHSDRPLMIGASGEEYHEGRFVGAIDEASLYGRALSATEVQSIFRAGALGKCKPPLVDHVYSTTTTVAFPPAPPGADAKSTDTILTAAPPAPDAPPVVVTVALTSDVDARNVQIHAALGSLLRLLVPDAITFDTDNIRVGAGGELSVAGNVVGDVTVSDGGVVFLDGTIVGDVFNLEGYVAKNRAYLQLAIARFLVGPTIRTLTPDRIVATGITVLRMIRSRSSASVPAGLAGGTATDVPRPPKRLAAPAEPSTGLLPVQGAFNQAANGTLFVGIGGPAFVTGGAQEYDRVEATGVASLDGIIAYDLIDLSSPESGTHPFEPNVGERFDIVVAAKIDVGNLVIRGPVWGTGLGMTWDIVPLPDGREALRLTAASLGPPLAVGSRGSSVEIFYPTNFSGFFLQSSEALRAGWTNLSSGTNVVIVNPTNAARFFRLGKPEGTSQ